MKADIKVQLQNLGNSVYRATYTPTVPGAYLLNVMWSDRWVTAMKYDKLECPVLLKISFMLVEYLSKKVLLSSEC